MRILAADIGGTHSRFALFHAPGKQLRNEPPEAKVWLRTTESDSFPALLDRLVREVPDLDPSRADAAVIAVPGAVRKGTYCDPVNIRWDIDLEAVPKGVLPASTLLINDFEAQSWYCASPAAAALPPLHAGEPVPKAARAVVGPGTGLGKGSLICLGQGLHAAVPSEGGHVSFPFEGEAEFAYAEFIHRTTGLKQIVGDNLLTGSGMVLLHHFLTGERVSPEEAARACTPDSEQCAWFARMLARISRNYVLDVLALGGLFITGGLAARNPALAEHPAFLKEFRFSETQADILSRVPVYLVADQDSGLWGAASCGLLALGAQSW